MYVKIGPYIKFIGPYQLANLLQKVGVSEDRCDEIGEKLSNSFVGSFLNWIYEKRKRKVRVKIHNYDVWSADSTLAIVIAPVLRELKKSKHGSPFVDNEDVPDHLHSVSDEFGHDELVHEKWEYILDEMIWAFTELEQQALGIRDWEDEYTSGDTDFSFVEDDENPELFKMVTGPKHTFVFDRDGAKKHRERIQNGLRLFSKYYFSLWD